MVREVWAASLDSEWRAMMEVAEAYPVVAMDTEFPGVVSRPVGSFRSAALFHYETIKCNVDMLKLIQVGLSFWDEDGNPAPDDATWQFNLHFDMMQDVYAQSSIELLQQSGIDFARHKIDGIDPVLFAEKFTVSGVPFNPAITWVSFHGGYDFAYLLRLLSGQDLPEEEADFFQLLQFFFPTMYDSKVLMQRVDHVMGGGLEHLATALRVHRVGTAHQAGSDAHLTAQTYFALAQRGLATQKYNRIIYGLGDFNKQLF